MDDRLRFGSLTQDAVPGAESLVEINMADRLMSVSGRGLPRPYEDVVV